MIKVRVGPGAYFGIRTNTKDAEAALNALKDRLQRASPFYREVGRIFRAAVRRNFAQGGVPPWKPLAASTIAEKAAAGYPEPNARTKSGKVPKRLMQNGNFGPANILIRTGKMRDALGVRGAPGNVTDIKDDGAYFGINPDIVPYAAVHEYGGRGSYPIHPAQATRLRFFCSEGYVVYSDGVVHPPLPQRRMTTMQEQDFIAIQRAAKDHLSAAVRIGTGD